MTTKTEAARLAEEAKRLAKELNSYGVDFPDGKGIFGEAALVLLGLAALVPQAAEEVARDAALKLARDALSPLASSRQINPYGVLAAYSDKAADAIAAIDAALSSHQGAQP